VTKKTNLGKVIETINYVQELRKTGMDFDAINDKLTELNIELDIRWDTVDIVKRQEKNTKERI